MSVLLRLLMVEDSVDDAELLLHTLRRGGFEVVWLRVENAETMENALRNGEWDIITSDHAMPHFSAPQALALAHELCPEIPLIIVSGEIDLNLAVSLMKSGAQDYIQKHELARVVPAIERELNDAASRRQQRRTEEALQRQQALMSRIYETSPVGIVMVDRIGKITFANREAERVLGLRKDVITQLAYNAPEWRITAFDGGPFPDEDLPFTRVLSTGQAVRDVQHAIEWPDGQRVLLSINATPLTDENGQLTGMVATVHDITNQSETADALRVREAQLCASLENTPNVAIQWYDCDGRVAYWNPASEMLYGWSAIEASGKTLDQLIYTPQQNAIFKANLQHILATGEPVGPYESIFRRRDGSEGIILSTQFAIPSESAWPVFVCMDVEVTPLKQSQRNLETLFNTLGDLLFVLDREGRIRHVNNTVVRVLGFSAQELIGQSVLMVHPEERRSEAAAIVAAMLAGEAEACPVPLKTKNGSQIPVETRVMAGQWDGQPALFGISRDISVLKLSEEKFARAFYASAVVMAISTVADGRYLEVNDAFLETFGFSRQEVLGHTSAELQLFVDPEARELVRHQMEHTQRVKGIETQIRCKDGKILTGVFSASFIYLGIEPCWITTMIDITQRKQIENTLVETKAMLDAAIEQTPIPMVLVSMPDGILRYANRASIEFLGVQDEPSRIGTQLFQFCQQTWQDFDCQGNPVPITEMPLGRAMRGQATTMQEYYIQRKDGTYRWELVTGMPIYDPTGHHQIAAYIVFSDITPLKTTESALRASEQRFRSLTLELEKRVNERTRQLEASNKELEAFIHSVSHDLRAPLRSIEGYSKILLENYAQLLDEQASHYLQRLNVSAQQLGQLVTDLLDLSQLSRTQMHLSLVNLSALAHAIVADLRESAPERVVEFSAVPDITAWADANLMRIVLDNLLRNAWKFTGNCSVAQITFGVTKNAQDEIVYTLRDNGAGFDMKYVDRLFVAFQRLHTSQEFDGTGIGLTTVQRIIHRHGGRIWAEGAPGQGATFFFTLMAQPYEES